MPIMHGDQVLGEIDIDSDRRSAFGDADRDLLESVARFLAPRLVTPRVGRLNPWPALITLIPGDGIGPEVTAAVVRIFKAAGGRRRVGATRRRRHRLQAIRPVAAGPRCSTRSARTRWR